MDSAQFIEILNGILQRQSKLQKMLEYQNDRMNQMFQRQFTSDKVMHRVQGMLVQALGDNIYEKQALLMNKVTDHKPHLAAFQRVETIQDNNVPVSQKSLRQNYIQNQILSNKSNDLQSKKSFESSNRNKEHHLDQKFQQLQNDSQNYDYEVFSEASQNHQLIQKVKSKELSNLSKASSYSNRGNSIKSNSILSNKNSQHKIGMGISLSKNSRDSSLNKMTSNGIQQNLFSKQYGNDFNHPQRGIFQLRQNSPSINDASVNDRSNSNSSRKRINSIPKQLLNAKMLLRASPNNICFNQFRYEQNTITPRFNGWYQLLMDRPINLNQRSYFQIKIVRSSNCNVFIGATNWQRIQSTSSYNSGKAVALKLNDCYVHVKSTVIRNDQKKIPNGSIIRVDIQNQVISWWKGRTLLAKVTIPQQLSQRPLFPYIEMFDRDDVIQLV